MSGLRRKVIPTYAPLFYPNAAALVRRDEYEPQPRVFRFLRQTAKEERIKLTFGERFYIIYFE